MPNYLEGNVYTIDGKKRIYYVDGTFSDASLTPKKVGRAITSSLLLKE